MPVITDGTARLHLTSPLTGRDLDRFRANVQIDPNTGCHLWTGTRNPKGYGLIFVSQPKRALRPVHRASYITFIGPIPDGHELDHRCHTDDPTCPGGDRCPHRACVNPAHLEPVTHRDNVLRGNSFSAVNAAKTHCLRGHEFTQGSYYTIPSSGGRQCLPCRAITRAAWRERRRATSALAGGEDSRG